MTKLKAKPEKYIFESFELGQTKINARFLLGQLHIGCLKRKCMSCLRSHPLQSLSSPSVRTDRWAYADVMTKFLASIGFQYL